LLNFFVRPHLLKLLENANLDAISANMAIFNREQEQDLKRKWGDVFDRVREAPKTQIGSDFDDQMYKMYGLHTMGPDPPIDGLRC